MESNWNRLFDCEAELLQLAVEDAALEWRLYRHHAASDVDADGCRNDRIPGGHHGTNHAAFAQMRIGHQRDVPEQTWQARNVSQHRLFFVTEFMIGPRKNFGVSATDS